MSNSAFTFKNQSQTIINDSGTVNITQNITQSQAAHQIFDWVEVNGCIEPGDVLYRNPNTGEWNKALATTLKESEVVGVVETTNGCGIERDVKLVYQGRINFPVTYTVVDGGVYFLDTELNDASIGPSTIRNASLTEPECLSKPVWIGTGPRQGVVVNHRGLTSCGETPDVQTPIGIVNIQTKECYDDGVVFVVKNTGAADITETVTWTAYSGSGNIITNGAIAGIPLGINVRLSFTGSNSMDEDGWLTTSGSQVGFNKTETSGCTIDVGGETINVRLVSSEDFSRFPSNTGWYESNEFTSLTAGNVTFNSSSGTFVSQQIGAIVIQESGSLNISTNHSTIGVKFAGALGEGLYTYSPTQFAWTTNGVPMSGTSIEYIRFT